MPECGSVGVQESASGRGRVWGAAYCGSMGTSKGVNCRRVSMVCGSEQDRESLGRLGLGQGHGYTWQVRCPV